MTQATPTVESDRYLDAVASSERDQLTWWRKHVSMYPHCAAVAGCFIVITASSATGKHMRRVEQLNSFFSSDIQT